jgi:hypothetical protein
MIDAAVEKVGISSLKSKAHLPTGLLCVLYENDIALCHILLISYNCAHGAGM